jgi:hypothetical protein
MTARLTRLKGTALESGSGGSQSGPPGPPGAPGANGEVGGIPEAPEDGKLYARKDGEWVEIIGTGTGDVNGPGGSDDGTIPVFDGVTGKVLKDSSHYPEDFALVDHGHGSTVGHAIAGHGVPFTNRTILNFSGFGVSVIDNPGEDTTEVDFTADAGTETTRPWDPMYPPAVPHEMDDEFNDEEFDSTKWITFDIPESIDIQEHINGMELHTHADEISGIIQPIPAGNVFTAWTRVFSQGAVLGATAAHGMFLCSDAILNPATSSLLLIASFLDNYSALCMNIFTVDNYTFANPYTHIDWFSDPTIPGPYLRARYNNDDLVVIDASGDGVSWRNIWSVAFTPKQVGLYTRKSTDARAVFPFFRVTESFDPFQIMGGSRGLGAMFTS